MHALFSYALRQHNTVKLFGLIGCGNIGPGWRSLAVLSVANCLSILFPWGGVVLLMRSLWLRCWLLAALLWRGIRLLAAAVASLGLFAFERLRVFG